MVSSNPFEEISGQVQKLDEVVQKVLQLIEGIADAKSAAAKKKWLTRKEVAIHFGICISQVDNLVRKGLLKKHKVGSLTRFDSNEVDDALDNYQKHQRKDPDFG